MAASVRVAQLRADLAMFRERVRRGTYPSALRERAVAYAARRARGGAAAAEVASGTRRAREVTASNAGSRRRVPERRRRPTRP